MTHTIALPNSRLHSLLVLASPILVIIIGHLAARFFTAWSGEWAWVGTALIYWGSSIAIIFLLGGQKHIRRWFSKSQGSRWWVVAAIAMGLISIPIFLIPNLRVFSSLPLVLAWFIFGIINSTCEEVYWRGFMLDETAHLPRAFGVLYSTVLFASIHPLMLGVYSKIQALDPANPLRLLPFLIIVTMLGLFYCLIYFKTKSLRLAILSHFLCDLGNMSIFLFMNIITM